MTITSIRGVQLASRIRSPRKDYDQMGILIQHHEEPMEVDTALNTLINVSERPRSRRSPRSKSPMKKRAPRRSADLLKWTLINEAKKKAMSHVTTRSRHSSKIKQPSSSCPINIKDVLNLTTEHEYALDIHTYWKDLEKQSLLPTNYLRKETPGKILMRNTVMDWLLQVQTSRQLQLDTFYLAQGIVDRYLLQEDLCIADFKVLGATAILIATKYEENDQAKWLNVQVRNATSGDITDLEKKVLRALDFNLGFPSPLNFYELLSKLAGASAKENFVAKYIMEVSTCNHLLAPVPPSLYAAAATYLALKISRRSFVWTDTLARYSGYHEKALMPVVRHMSRVLMQTVSRKFRFVAAKNKYTDAAFLRVSSSSQLTSTVVQKLAKF